MLRSENIVGYTEIISEMGVLHDIKQQILD